MNRRGEYLSTDIRERRIKILEAELAEAREAIRDLLVFADTSWLPPRMLRRISRAAGIDMPPSEYTLKRMPISAER